MSNLFLRRFPRSRSDSRSEENRRWHWFILFLLFRFFLFMLLDDVMLFPSEFAQYRHLLMFTQYER